MNDQINKLQGFLKYLGFKHQTSTWQYSLVVPVSLFVYFNLSLKMKDMKTCSTCKKKFPKHQMQGNNCKVCAAGSGPKLPDTPPPKETLIRKIEEIGKNFDEKFYNT
jgi:hypothetical protein